MRIISGTARGRRLATLEGRGIRPTPDRVREALFNILQHRFDGFADKRVLDLFSGSGALALEALSRGAALAVMVDRSSQSARVIRENIRTCGMSGRASLVRGDVDSQLPRLADGRRFDLIFLDPPYRQGLIPLILARIDSLGLLETDGLICCESAREDDMPSSVGHLRKIYERVFGSTTIHLYGGKPNETDLS